MRLLIIILYVFSNYVFALSNTQFFDKLNTEEKEFLKTHPQIIVSNEKDWAPYDYNEQGVAKGYSIDYLKLIGSKLGVEFKFETDTWSNLIEKIKAKEIDIIHPISYIEKRKEYINYAKSILDADLSIVSTDIQSEIDSLNDLKFKTVAVVKGWSSTKYLKKNYPEIIFKEFDTSKEKLEAVAFGKADAAIEYFITANYIKNRYLLNNLKIVHRIEIEDLKRSLHIAVRKDWEILVPIINKAIESITEEEILLLNRKWMNVKDDIVVLTEQEKDFLKKIPYILTRVAKDYYPFSFTEDSKEKGYVIDYTNLIAKKLGIEVRYVKNQTWKESIQDLKDTRIDILPMMKKTPEREMYAIFSTPLLETYIGIATLEKNIKKASLETLSGKKVGILGGYWFVDNLKKHYPKIKRVIYKSNLEALVGLKAGEIDAVVSTEPVMQYLIKRNFFSEIKTKPILNNVYLPKTIGRYAIRKDWPLMESILRKTMATIKEKDILALKEKWFGKRTNFSNPLGLKFNNDELMYMKNKKVIKMCVDPNWMPYEQIKNNKHIGMSSDYFDIFRKVIPIPVKLVNTDNWTQTLSYVKQRKCDLISLAIPTPMRLKYLDFSKSYIDVPLVMATDLMKPFVTSFTDVLNYKIGVVKGYAYYEILKNKYPKLNLVEVENVDDGMNKVISGEIYGFVDSLAVVGYSVQKNYLGSVKIAGEVDENLELGVAVRNDEPLLKSIFDKIISELKPSDHRSILNKWVSVTYDKSFDSSLAWKIAIAISIILGFFFYRQNMLKKQNNMLLNSQKILQEANEEFEHLINSTIEAIFVWKDDKCINANSEAVKLFGYKDKSDLLELSALDIVDPLFHEEVKEKREKKLTSAYEINAIKMDGTVFPVLVKGYNFILRNSEVRVSAFIDLSDIKHKERLLTEHTKMVALGEMLGNIAHQWRQPLSVISTAASGIQIQKDMGMLNDNMFNETMDSIVLNTNYLSNTINDFTNFIKDNKTKKDFDLKEHIKKDLTILNSMIKTEHINVVTNIEEDIIINNFENEFSQAIINIISNSKDAFVERNIENRLILIDGKKENNTVLLTIKDNANGISKDILDKVFEPYFTTKHKSQGTGVGLYMTNKIIVESMKGTIDVSNDNYTYEGVLYKGAMFRLTL
ncbi:transporter substrate-binding domain-containing protein [Arcobacter sp. LA11]|uniref:transporter substrate-binding domain-containing protein n=1 Tax=Arcobacter sp. LA11 TaxID=1898176 RepID=UPI000933D9AB|nr:transporter substrate-binding domain-containing protein [Arcobacter sp. LA11]